MNKAITVLLFILLHVCCFGQDSVVARLVLIGDAGQLIDGKQPVIAAVRQNIPLDKRTTVVFLGDNLYKTGLPDEQVESYLKSRSILDTQLTVNRGTDAKAIFIPGNHDWNHEQRGGWDAVVRQQLYIDQQGNANVSYQPKGGCPGPVEIDITPDVLMIVLDTQWWLHLYDKPGIESDCPYKTREEVLNHLDDIVTRNTKKLILFTSHHPFKSYGVHGGYYTLKTHIFPFTEQRSDLYIPLPVLGSLYPIVRGVFGTAQDLKHPAYVNMANDIQTVVKQHPNVVFLAGHEHSLQLIKDSSYHYIVSGSGSKSTRVSSGENTLYKSAGNGFALMEISKSKNVRVSFYTVENDTMHQEYSENILNFSKLPAPNPQDTIPIVYVPYSADSITVAANKHYGETSGFKRFLNGDNYRATWAQPVTLKVFRLNEQGFTVESLGGGKQTRSLRLKDKQGREWVLRSINKDLSKILPASFRGNVAQDYIQDFISTAHPYSPLIVPPLANAVHVIAADPRIYFVPNDPALGFYRRLFANTVCLLERREPTPRGEDTKSTQNIIARMLEDNDDRIDQEAVLRARLLDFLIADWDRHADQWRFGEADTGKGKLYYPIPRDRDQAFSYSDGFLPRLISVNNIPFLKGFRNEIDGIKWLAYWGKDFDRFFMNRLDSSAWNRNLDVFTNNISNRLIDSAVKRLPPEIYAINGPTIAQKLKSRLVQLPEHARKYYRFLSEQVAIVGSNKHEYFKIESVGDNLQVRMYKRSDKGDSLSIIYDRIFEPSITEEVHMYGLNGNDIFEVDENVSSKIKLRFIGGRGNDTFNLRGNLKSHVYDLTTEQNYLANQRRSNIHFSDDPSVHRYSQTGFRYDRYKFPAINAGYNIEDGVLLGVGFSRKTEGFRKEPFSTLQRLSTLYALHSGAYQVRYRGEFNQLIRGKDLVVNADLSNPVLNNFFGLGNETPFDDNKDRSFYRVRYKYVSSEVLLRKRIGEILQFSAGPQFYHYWDDYADNKDRILGNPALVGLDSADIYRKKTYLGGKAGLLINNLDNVLLPTRGIWWYSELSSMGALTRGDDPITKLTSDMEIHAALRDPAKLVAVLRLGAGHIFSKNFEYFQALNLGINNYLRGYRKNRFSGNSLAYGSVELRIKLFASQSYLFPGDIGFIVFNDVGRVWMRNEQSEKWHHSYGGGLYYAAFNSALIAATIGISEETHLFNLSLGTKFNLTF